MPGHHALAVSVSVDVGFDFLLQALRPGVHGSKDGALRATFEDKPLLSDTVRCRCSPRAQT